MWAGYALSFRRSGLTPWVAAALLNTWSLMRVIAFTVAGGGSKLLDAPRDTLASELLWQGLFAGVLGLWTYSVAIERLGAARQQPSALLPRRCRRWVGLAR
ncbi:hypothetical protein WDZ92_25130 [Nostoc sp. NIES-2111]